MKFNAVLIIVVIAVATTTTTAYAAKITIREEEHEHKIVTREEQPSNRTIPALSENWTSISASATVDLGWSGYLVDTTSGAVTLTFPDISANDGSIVSFKKISSSANNLVIAAGTGQTIDGVSSKTLLSNGALRC